jgi:hypothetical protein
MKFSSRVAGWTQRKESFVAYSTSLYGSLVALFLVGGFALIAPHVYPAFVYYCGLFALIAYAGGWLWSIAMWYLIFEPRSRARRSTESVASEKN